MGVCALRACMVLANVRGTGDEKGNGREINTRAGPSESAQDTSPRQRVRKRGTEEEKRGTEEGRMQTKKRIDCTFARAGANLSFTVSRDDRD